MMNNRVLRIAGSKENLEIRPSLSRLIGQLPAIKRSRKADISKQEFYLRLTCHQTQGRITLRCLRYIISEFAQNFGCINTHILIVFHDKNCFMSSAIRRLNGVVPLDRACLRSDTREIKPNGRTFAGFAVYLDVPPGLFDESIYLRKSQPGALAEFLSRKKWLKGFFDNLGGHANPGVADRQHDILTCRHFSVGLGIGFIQICVGRLKREFSAFGHCIPRIDGEVENRIFDLIRVR